MTDLPTGWEWTTIGDLTVPVSKVDPRSEPNREFDYIDIGGVDGDRGEILETQRLTGSEAPSRARQLVRTGDTVLSTVRTYMRKSAQVPSRLDGQVASTGFSVLRPAEGVHPMYLYHSVRRQEFVDTLSSLQSGSSYPAVRDKDIRSMPVPLAPKAEQERIVAAIEEHLSRLDAAERSLRSAHARLGTFRSATTSEALKGDWPVARLGAHTLDQRYGSSAKASRAGDVPVLRMGNIVDGHLDFGDLKYLPCDHPDLETCDLEPGDLLFNRTNSPELVGKSAVFAGHPTEVTFASYLIRVRLDEELDPHWTATVINSPIGRRYIEAVRTQQVGQANVNGTKLKEFPIPMPPVEAQRERLAQLEQARLWLKAVESEINRALQRAASLRRSILAAAFSGMLVPQDPTDTPASVLLERIRAERAATTPTKRNRRAKAS